MSKIINFDTEARTKLKRGVDLLANSVKTTLGPKGRNVIIEQPYGPPRITKDGVSVAREIELPDPFENTGAKLVQMVASKTCDDGGDGTTTASVLTQSIVNAGIKNLEAGANPVELKKGIDSAVKVVVKYIKEKAIAITGEYDKLLQVATISANNDPEIGKLITDAFKAVSNDGVITIEESKTSETFMSVVEGMQFNRGYASPYFVTNTDTAECEFENPYFLIYDGKIQDIKQMIKLLEAVFNVNRPLVLIANDFDSEAISTLVMNKVKNNFKLCCVKSPGFGENQREYLYDIATVTGATLINEGALGGANVAHLGASERVSITRDTTTIINGKSDSEKLKKRIKEVKESLSKNPTPTLTDRLGKLSGGVAILYVGANSEVEMKEKKDRVDDALCAARAALEEGIIPGGGTTYLESLDALDELIKANTGDIATGVSIIRTAITKPLYTIADNAGKEGGAIVQEVLRLLKEKKSIGYNAKLDKFEDMFQAGVIDPAKVARVALENAASVGSLILTAGCVICNNPDHASN
jgi:chaperonin GroEL